MNYCLLPAIVAHASILQRGFVPGRQLGQNIIDLDFQMRAHSLKFLASSEKWLFNMSLLHTSLSVIFKLPIGALFDYAAAFPSVSHVWLRAILCKIGIPRGFVNAFNALYNGNEGYTSIGGFISWIFSVGCGVLQGCPLSGSLFVIAIDPLLYMFEKYIVSVAWQHVCVCGRHWGGPG